MKRKALLICIIVLKLASELPASPLEDIASSDQSIRDKAAAELRGTYEEIPQSKWQPIVDEIQRCPTKTEVMALLKPFNVTSDMIMASGHSHSESYRLDGGWVLTCAYRNKGDVFIDGKLSQSIKYVWVVPPKDFTGKWTTYFVNGQKSHEVDYKNGHYFGEFTCCYANGNKNYVQHYDETGVNGEDVGFHPSGHIAYNGQYKAGRQVGKWIWYDHDGNITSTQEKIGLYKYDVTYFPDKSKPPHGMLFCNGGSLPLTFAQVVTPLGEFIGSGDGGSGDWQRVEKGLVLGERTLSGESTKASIAGTFEHPPEEVGNDWFYVVRKEFWVNPKRLYDVTL